MPVTSDIVATYRGPRTVFRRMLAMGEHEGRALAIVMAGCVVFFVADWPRLSRDAHILYQDLNQMLGGALMGWIFLAPLAFYVIAALSQLALRLLGRKPSGYDLRLALFWAFLAASPVKLLHGLAAGFIGPGPALTSVGIIWFGLFMWFWISNMREAGWGT